MGNQCGMLECGMAGLCGAARASTTNANRMPHVRRERNRMRVGAVSCFVDSD